MSSRDSLRVWLVAHWPRWAWRTDDKITTEFKRLQKQAPPAERGRWFSRRRGT